MARTAAVFFDVDFTLIHPGPRFQGSGYRDSCARLGIEVDEALFDQAVAGASCALDTDDHLYDPEIFIGYTRRIIELMGGTSPAAEQVAREMYEDWAAHHHFSLYDDVLDSLQLLASRGVRLGLISNSHRCLVSFQQHFSLNGLIAVAVSSAELGYMKPHRRIFQAALDLMEVPAAAAVMVGDSLAHDVMGARQAGMGGILLARGTPGPPTGPDVTVIHTLRDLPALVCSLPV